MAALLSKYAKQPNQIVFHIFPLTFSLGVATEIFTKTFKIHIVIKC